jgi:hypothetical protein
MTKKAPRGTLPNWDLWQAGLLPVTAIDPGEGTGVAVLAVPEDSIYGDAPPGITKIWNDEITGPEKQQVKELAALVSGGVGRRWGSYLPDPRPLPVVIEDFSLRIFSRGDELLAPVRITAMLDYALDALAIKAQLFRQQAADPQRVITDDMLKDWELYATGQKNARVAMKQAVHFLRRARQFPALREAAWGKR